MEVEKKGVHHAGNGTVPKKTHKKKANKHKSRNDFSDVQRIELNPSAPPVTTIDLLKSATDLDDLSKSLGERLAMTNGTHDDGAQGSAEEAEVRRAGAAEPPNVDLVAQPMDSTSNGHNIIYTGPAQNQVTYVAESGIESGGPSPANTTSSSTPPSSVDVSSPKSLSSPSESAAKVHIEYRGYESELQMPDIIRLIQRDLSEPYSVYTYRYFIHNWPELCFLAMHGEQCVGAIVCKLGMHRQIMKRGYIAMLAVDKEYRKLKIGTNLVTKAIEAMLKEQADEVVLETEITNTSALRLYENLGFVRDKRLFHYYLNGVDALRLKLWFR